MAYNPQAPQGPDGQQDPAGSTQMFRAFVNESPAQSRPGTESSGGGSRVGVVVGVVVVLVVLAALAWLALK